MEFVPESPEAIRAFLEAEDIAGRAGQPPGSAHLLLALFTFANRAQQLLAERGLDEDRLIREIRAMEDEPARTLHRIRERAKDIARGAAAREVDSLHLLVAITRLRDAFAYRLLERTGTSMTALRNVAVSYITGNMPRRYRTIPRPTASERPMPRTRLQAPQVLESPSRRAITQPVAKTAAALARQHEEALDEDDTDHDDETNDELDTELETEALDLGTREPELDATVDVAAETDDTPLGEDDEFAELAQAVDAAVPRPTVHPQASALLRPAPTTGAVKRPKTAAAPLDLEEVAPNLLACGIDLTAQARAGELDMVIGRDRELEALIDILGKRRANNPVLVGPPGVGKTAIVEGLAVKIARGHGDVEHFHDRVVFALDTGSLVAGTSLRGAFSERLGAIKAEVAAQKGRIIVFIDELHTLIGAGTSGEGPQDAANELKTALARGEFPCIGATTIDEYKKYIEKDAALERRFSPIDVNEPTPDEAILVLEGAVAPYSEHHNVAYSMEAVHAAVQLSHRFISERKLPDKAFAVIDLAGSRARRRGGTRVERLDVARIVHEWTGVPLERLAEADGDRFAQAESLIAGRFVGHDDVVQAVCRAIRRGFAGFNNRRPIGSFLFLGPTGVGKTELVKVLAEFLFGRRDAVVRVDMSEHAEAHSVARLIGAQPGYIGYEDGGHLTEALRKRPFQIVLFDEIEKAHRDVLNLLLQILDEGHLTDGRGRRVSFTNTLVVLTSNLGADAAGSSGRSIGFGQNDDSAPGQAFVDKVLHGAQHDLAPELWGRLDERLVFRPLTRAQVQHIAALQLEESSRVLFAEREVGLRWSDEVLTFLLDHGGFSPETGARGMRQAIQRQVEAPVAEAILAGRLGSSDTAEIRVDGEGLSIQRASDDDSRA